MNTKDVLLVLGGVAIGYLALKMNFGKRTITAVGDVATGIVADVKDVTIDSSKMSDCQKKLDVQTSTMRFASAEAGENFRKKYLAECMASK